jgi:hypothetical protein
MMAFIDKAVTRWKEERQRKKGLLEWMKSGKAKFGTWSPGAGSVDTTPADIERYTRKIAELDALIARHPEGK